MNNVEIERLSDTEYQTGNNKISLIEGNIIFVVTQGEQTGDIALNQKKICEILSSDLKGKVNYLIDLNKCGKTLPKAREIYKELTESEKTNKVATFGLNPVSKVIATFVIIALRKGLIRFFNKKQDAINWLLS